MGRRDHWVNLAGVPCYACGYPLGTEGRTVFADDGGWRHHGCYIWDVDAPLGPWTITWDIPCEWESPLDQLARAVIANWQPVPMWQGEMEPIRAKKYKAKGLGYIYL